MTEESKGFGPNMFYENEMRRVRGMFAENMPMNVAPTIDELLEREDIEPKMLPRKIKQETVKILKGDINDDRTPEIRFIYETYVALHDYEGTDRNLAQLASDMASFDSFKQKFFPKATNKQIANLYRGITFFKASVVHPSRMMVVEDEKPSLFSPNGIYGFSGEWFVLPKRERRQGFWDITDRDVVEEAIKLRDAKVSADIFHTTGSAALTGIGEDNEIMCAKKIQSASKKVLTGEYISYISDYENVSLTGGKDGLPNVYVTEGGISKGYELVRWFNEYSVTFGLPLHKQKAYVESRYGQNTLPFVWTSEGMLAGPEILLEHITLLVVDHPYLAQARAWSAEHTPGAVVTSYDAYELCESVNRGGKYRTYDVDKLEELLTVPSFKIEQTKKIF